MSDDILRLFALWMLTHEAADEEMRAAVTRGQAAGPEGMTGGPDAFVDGLAALVAEEKDRLKREIVARAPSETMPSAGGATLDDVRFEIAEVRGRLDAIEARLDALMRAMER